jgi:hypothetical protein
VRPTKTHAGDQRKRPALQPSSRTHAPSLPIISTPTVKLTLFVLVRLAAKPKRTQRKPKQLEPLRFGPISLEQKPHDDWTDIWDRLLEAICSERVCRCSTTALVRTSMTWQLSVPKNSAPYPLVGAEGVETMFATVAAMKKQLVPIFLFMDAPRQVQEGQVCTLLSLIFLQSSDRSCQPWNRVTTSSAVPGNISTPAPDENQDSDDETLDSHPTLRKVGSKFSESCKILTLVYRAL